MNKKEAFKDFLKRNKDLSKLVIDGKTTYQKLFETFDIYGEDKSVWNDLLKSAKKVENSNFGGFKDILSNLKNIDIDKLEENVGSLEKALGFLEEILSSRNEKKEKKREKSAKATEIERFFDD